MKVGECGLVEPDLVAPMTRGSHGEIRPGPRGVTVTAAEHSQPSETPTTEPPGTGARLSDRPERGLPLDVAAAAQLIRTGALSDQPVGAVGVEIEGHVFRRGHLREPVELGTLQDLRDDSPCLPGGGRITLEPGGQLEISSACASSSAEAIAATRADMAVVRHWLRQRGMAWVLLGADPVRPPRLANSTPRYTAMRDWFAAGHSGCTTEAGTTMMCSTAALQINLNAGRPDQWARRVDRAQRLAPVLTALTGSSTHLSGADTRWCSARQRAWSGLDPLTSGSIPGGADPAQEWVDRALAAPVMFLETSTGCRASERRRTLREWLVAPDGWPPATADDVRRHLTTLFPPVRLRGWLELRCMDSLPDHWWPAVVAAVVAWMDLPELDEPVSAALDQTAVSLERAARIGLADSQLRTLATDLLTLAVPVASTGVRPDLIAWLDLVRNAQTPGSLIAADARRRGASTVVKELIDA